ncbi:MAG: hypothetical protein ABI698_05215 [bacterium]
MKKPMKIGLIILALALLAGVVLVGLRTRESDETDETVAASVSETSRGPSFEVRVVMPRSGRPLGGILPDWIVKKLDGTPSQAGFDNASPGARIGNIGNDRLALTTDDGWDLSIEADGDGRITSGTRLVFPLALGGRQVKLRCRPTDPGNGYLLTGTRAGDNALSGRFLVKLATCENADSGKPIEWPPAPLTLRGSFASLPPGSR